VNKTASSAAKITNCILLHGYSSIVQLQLPAAQAQTKTPYTLFNKLA